MDCLLSYLFDSPTALERERHHRTYMYIARVVAVWPMLVLKGAASIMRGSKFNLFNQRMHMHVIS